MYWGSCTVSSSLSVAGGGETMLTVGADRTPSASARAIVSRIRTGSKGCPAPKSYLVRASSQTTAVDPLTLSRASELAAAVAGRLDRREEGGAYPVLLKLADRRDRRARGRRHRVPQDDRVLSRVAQHRRRAVNDLRHHLKRRPAWHAKQDARVHHRLDQVEHVRRPGARQRGRRVLLVLGYADHLAERREQFLRVPQVLLARERAGGDHRHRLVHERGRVGHPPDH